MQMQEPGPQQQDSMAYQESQGYNEYQSGYPGRYEQEEQQKVYPPQLLNKKGLWITTLVLSSVGYFFALAGVIASANVVDQCVRFAYQSETLAGAIIALVSSICLLLICIALFVISITVLAKRKRRRRVL